MAPGNVAADFNAIINKGKNSWRIPSLSTFTNALADRQRRKTQALATEILGKNRRQSAPGGGNKSGPGGPLASRVGIAKVNMLGHQIECQF